MTSKITINTIKFKTESIRDSQTTVHGTTYLTSDMTHDGVIIHSRISICDSVELGPFLGEPRDGMNNAKNDIKSITCSHSRESVSTKYGQL